MLNRKSRTQKMKAGFPQTFNNKAKLFSANIVGWISAAHPPYYCFPQVGQSSVPNLRNSG